MKCVSGTREKETTVIPTWSKKEREKGPLGGRAETGGHPASGQEGQQGGGPRQREQHRHRPVAGWDRGGRGGWHREAERACRAMGRGFFSVLL